VPLARVDTVAGAGGASRAEVRHLHTDHLGTPREMTVADGRVVWAARYRAWGSVLEVVQEEVALTDEIGDAQPVRFQGQYHDNESGLHYNRFRYYDPDIGRFVSVDPIGLMGGVNTYQYSPNPVASIDPLGLSPCDGLAFRADLQAHMVGPDGFTKSGQLSGTHNLNNAIAELKSRGATYTLNPTNTLGISRLDYIYMKPGTGKLISGKKTVYDPAILSDTMMMDNAQLAGQAGWTQYLLNPNATVFDSMHGGVNFRSYVNFDKNGNAFIGNVHPVE
jgi:RHS repeat-associated protein